MDHASVKKEILEAHNKNPSDGGGGSFFAGLYPVIALSSDSSSSSSESDSDYDDVVGIVLNKNNNTADEDGTARVSKKQKLLEEGNNNNRSISTFSPKSEAAGTPIAIINNNHNFKQFWKAGDYEGLASRDWDLSTGGMDHVRVHPKFLHSNATSHKWALGAFAELMDNSLDEVCNGSTHVIIDMLENKKDGSRMLLIEDNGGGMDPDKMRQCMSLGYSAKSHIADTIGQYGNGFKTSTMRLGADVIVFSRSPGKDGKRPTQSIGLLSYTFLRSTGKEDIVVPMLDYEEEGANWEKIIRSSPTDWDRNVETMVQWSPFCSEDDLIRQLNLMTDHGTRIIIYNLWEDDQGLLELDFDADPHDIQLRGVNRDEKNISMAKEFPNSRHFLTYKHSLRSYASILYLRLPPCFRIILRGKDVEHHNIVNDMMMSEMKTYKPQPGAEGVIKDSDITAVVTIGFVKDAKFHIDVQGFNVYHKNRLIKPFWRIWSPAGSDGRGVIGVLEANFVEPAHDKQGFERTTVLARLEQKLVNMQKDYWRTKCHKIGYAPRGPKMRRESAADEDTPTGFAKTPSQAKKASVPSQSKSPLPDSDKHNRKKNGKESENGKGGINSGKTPTKGGNSFQSSSHFATDTSDYELRGSLSVRATKKSFGNDRTSSSTDLSTIDQLKEENLKLTERIKKRESELLRELQKEKDKCKSFETQLEEAQQKIKDMNTEQEGLIDVITEERERRDKDEKNLRKKLKEASNTIQELLDKVKQLETIKSK